VGKGKGPQGKEKNKPLPSSRVFGEITVRRSPLGKMTGVRGARGPERRIRARTVKHRTK